MKINTNASISWVEDLISAVLISKVDDSLLFEELGEGKSIVTSNLLL